jgi:DNA ligase (NAD+)
LDGIINMAEDNRPFEEAGKGLIISTNNELINARHAYYAQARPIMTDAEYDRMEQQLYDMVKGLPQFRSLATILTTVGSDMVNSGGRIKHRTPMLSLDKTYDFAELTSWLEQFPGQQFVIEPKVDGCSCSTIYINRKLIKAVTRGDGLFGEDVTKQMAASGAVPLTLPEEFYPETPVEIRGEVFIAVSQFDKLNKELEAEGEKPYASPRNLAAGSMKLLDLEAVRRRGLRMFVWEVNGIPQDYLSKRSASLDYCHQAIQYVTRTNPCFPQSILSVCCDPQGVVDAIDNQIRKEREIVWLGGLGMHTDGVVIKLVSPQARKEAGLGTRTPHWGLAWKYPSEKKGTVLKDVVWQTGRTGSLTPVGILDPINIGGAMVSRVNLNNYSFITELGIGIGDEVLIKRGGEVIPVCSGISLKSPTSILIPEPTVCACGAPIISGINPKSGVLTHWCDNFECSEQLKAKLCYVADRSVLEIDELGPELSTKLVEEDFVTTFSDLMEFSNSIITGLEKSKSEAVSLKLTGLGFSAAQIIKMCKSLETVKTREWDRWLASLEIPGIGRVMSKGLATLCRLQPDDMPRLRDILTKALNGEKIDGIGDVKKTEVLSYFATHGQYFDEEVQALYDAGVRPKALIQAAVAGEQPLAGYVVCITGEFYSFGEREHLQKCLASIGATIKTGVSKKLTHLIAGAEAGRSKLAKAKELNIPLLREDWLRLAFTDNHLPLKPKGFEAEDADDGFI